MAITRKKKEEVISKVSDVAAKVEAIFFIDSSALKAIELNELRKKIKATGGMIQVVKKRLAKRAFESVSKLHPEIFERKGSLTIIAAPEGDSIGIAKMLYQFAKAHEPMKIIGAFLGNDFLPVTRVVNLAKLPSREVLLGQLVGLLSSPMRGLVIVLNGNTQKLVFALEAIKRSKSN